MPKLKPLINWNPSLYDSLAKSYDRLAAWFFPIGERGKEKVVASLESGHILDIACGTGTLLDQAQNQGLNCLGMDTSRGMLEEVRKKNSNIDLIEASFYALPFPDGFFEYVVETNAVSGADIEAEQILAEMIRVCQRGGEVRLGDYGRSGRDGFWFSLMEKIGILFGDYPHDFQAMFSSLGYEIEIESLGWGGMYQFIKLIR